MFLTQSIILAVSLGSITAMTIARDMELKMLHVIFRHGDKVPHREYQNYPNDPYSNHSFYPMASGDLTNEGKMREYKIGQMLRERYDSYFGPNYWPDQIYARSTEVPRTHMSLQLVLAGLFPPSEKQTWNPDLPWIPTYTFFKPSYKTDQLMFPHFCPLYQEEYKRFLQQSSTKLRINRYKNVLDYLTDHTGKPIEKTGDVTHLYNLFREEAAQNLTLPKWTENVFPNPLKEIVELDFHHRSYTKNLKRLNGGIMLRKIVDDIMDVINGRAEPDRKAYLLSAHEVNVAALGYALKVDEPKVPDYGATIIVETLIDKHGTYVVRVLLWNAVTEQLAMLKPEGCMRTLCPFDQFYESVYDVLPNDDEYHCRSSRIEDPFRTKMNHVSSAPRSVNSGLIFWYILLTVLLPFTSKFVQI